MPKPMLPLLELVRRSMRTFLAPCATLCTTLCLTHAPHALAQRQADPLAAAVQCVGKGRLGVLEVTRLPESVQARSVQTQQGVMTVSLQDGYRVILSTGQGAPFVNLKFELSRPDAVGYDREAVLQQMTTLAARGPRPLDRAFADGVETLALHQPTLDQAGPISFYSLLMPARGLIATAYVLNQSPSTRAFATYAEYEQLRDEAVGLVRHCMVAGIP